MRKKDLKSLKAVLQEKAGLKADPLTSFKLFNERTQRHDEKAGDFASELKNYSSKHSLTTIIPSPLFCFSGI